MQKYVNGQLVDLTPQEELEFNAEELEWALGADYRKAEEVRAERNKLLLEVDAISSNPLRWAELDAPTQALWATYRLELLDVPQQTGFPQTVVWPLTPEAI
jgi:hypothetical protein